MSDGASAHRPHDSLSVVLKNAMDQSSARVGIVVELLMHGDVKVWAHRSMTYFAPSSGHPAVMRSTSYDPHLLPDDTIKARLVAVRGQLRPKILTLPDGLRSPLARFYQVEDEANQINSLLAMPSGNSDFLLVLFGSNPWRTPSFDDISADLDRAVADFLSHRRGTGGGSATELALALSATAAAYSDSTTAIGAICKQLGSFLGFETCSAFSVEDDRLLPIAVCHLAARQQREFSSIEASMATGVFPAAYRAFELSMPIFTSMLGESKLPEAISNVLGLTAPSLLIPVLRSDRPVGLILLGNSSGEQPEILNDLDSVKLLISHLSLVFTQLLDQDERALRAQAWRGIQPMLDTANQISSAEELAEFFSRSLAVSLGLSSAFFVLVDQSHAISGIRAFGETPERIAELEEILVGYEMCRLPDYESLVVTHTQIFVETPSSNGYDPVFDRVFSNRPYLLIPIVTSAGLIGFGTGVQVEPKQFWNSRERNIVADWSLSATLLADNVTLRIAEKLHLETYREKAFKDSLTGLPNRELFHDRLGVAAIKAQRNQQLTSIIFLDVDLFKQVNDRFGHMAGDELLTQIAKRLTTSFRDTDTVARLSGDEFVVLVENSPNEADIVEIAKRAFDRLNDTYTIGSYQLNATISMGLAIGSPGIGGNELLERADQAMYRSKEGGRARLTVYSDSNGAESATLDLSAIERHGATENLAHADSTSAQFGAPQRFLRFSFDYVDFARLRAVLDPGSPQRSGEISPDRPGANIGSPVSRVDIGSIKLELIRPRLLETDPHSATPKPLAVLERLLGSAEIFLESAPNLDFKVLIDLDGLTVGEIPALATLVGKYQSEYSATHPIVMAVSSRSLNAESTLLVALSSLAARYQAEIMITAVEERTVRLYDLLMPMVTYLSVDAAEALSDSRRPVPSNLSAIAAIARDRGIRICAQGVTDKSTINHLVLGGITILSGPAIEEQATELFGSRSRAEIRPH